MPTPEGEPTHSRIFRNGKNGALQARGFGGVDPDNWRFNHETQNYDFIGDLDPDDIDPTTTSPENPIKQGAHVIKEVANKIKGIK